MSEFIQQYPIVLVLIGVGLGILIWVLAHPKPKKSSSKVPTPEPAKNPLDLILMANEATDEAVGIEAARIELEKRAAFGAAQRMGAIRDALNNDGPDANQLIAAIARHVQNCPASDPTPAAK